MTAGSQAQHRWRRWWLGAGVVLVGLVALAVFAAGFARRSPQVSVRLSSLKNVGGWRVARFTFTNASEKPFRLAGYKLSSQYYERFGDIPPGQEMMLTIPIPAAVTNATEIRFLVCGYNSVVGRIMVGVATVMGKPQLAIGKAVQLECAIPKAD